MQIEIVSVEVENKGKYRIATVTHKANGKVDAKKIMSFEKDAFKALSEAKQGDLFEVQFKKTEKDGKTYWNWVDVTPAGKNTEAGTSTKAASQAVRSTYETAEERAKRQVYIVRQSSISAAIELANTNKSKGPVTEADIIESAKRFEEYVFGIEPVVQEAEVS